MKIIAIHGVTKQKDRSGFADKFKKYIPSIEEFNWSQHIHPYQEKAYNSFIKEKGWITDKVGLAHIMTIGDAVIYPSVQKKIINELHQAVGGEQVIFITHSMGTVIALDYIMKYNPKIHSVYAFGTNLGLFYSETLQISGMEYHCFNEKNDFLGWANEEFFPFPINVHKFKSWNLLTGWNWGVHNSYWKSKKLAKKIKGLINE